MVEWAMVIGPHHTKAILEDLGHVNVWIFAAEDDIDGDPDLSEGEKFQIKEILSDGVGFAACYRYLYSSGIDPLY